MKVYLNPEGTHALPDDVSQLQSVDVEPMPGESLLSLARRAEEIAGLSVQHGHLLFVTFPSSEGRTVTQAPGAVVKEDGLLRWLRPYPYTYGDVTPDDLERTSRHGVFIGDPDAIILDHPTRGNGGVVHMWPELFHWLDHIADVIAAGTLMVAGRKVTRRFSRDESEEVAQAAAWLRDFLLRHREKFEERGATPVGFLADLLRPKQWLSSNLRAILGIDPQEAEKFLSVCGYEYNAERKVHELTEKAEKRNFRAMLLGEFLGSDPATWKEDLEGMEFEG